MAARYGKRVLWLLIAIAGVVAWKLVPRWLERRAGTERVVNQFWIERLPRDERDAVGWAVLLEKDGQRQGAFGKSSRWRQRIEGCLWQLKGSDLGVRFPQNDRTVRGRVRTWRCAGEAPHPFEWCLEIARGEHLRRYYSRDDWKVRPQEGTLDSDGARAELSWLATGLRPIDGLPEEEVGNEPDPGMGTPFDEMTTEP